MSRIVNTYNNIIYLGIYLSIYLLFLVAISHPKINFLIFVNSEKPFDTNLKVLGILWWATLS